MTFISNLPEESADVHHNHHLITIFVIIVMIILTIIGFGVQGRSEFSGFVSDPKAHASTGGKTSKSHGRGSTGGGIP